jgi:CopG family nickel-responsive transcriptional regulator
MIKKKRYENRSKAFRDLITNFLIEEKWESVATEVIGVITLLYDHDTKGITEKLIDIQHDMSKNVISTMHVHVDRHNCVEIIAIRGLPHDLIQISDRLISSKGVKHGKLVISSIENDKD